jgi:hypothetical protein
MTEQEWRRPRRLRSHAQVPFRTPLVVQAAWLYQHAWRLVHHRPGEGVDDALAVLALSTSLYHDAQRDGVRQALRAGATVGEIAIALGISTDDARDLVHRIEARPGAAAALPAGELLATGGVDPSKGQ